MQSLFTLYSRWPILTVSSKDNTAYLLFSGSLVIFFARTFMRKEFTPGSNSMACRVFCSVVSPGSVKIPLIQRYFLGLILYIAVAKHFCLIVQLRALGWTRAFRDFIELLWYRALAMTDFMRLRVSLIFLWCSKARVRRVDSLVVSFPLTPAPLAMAAFVTLFFGRPCDGEETRVLCWELCDGGETEDLQKIFY